MAANLQQQLSGVEFVRACLVFCQHMQKTTLKGILHALDTEDPELHEVTIDEETRVRALVPIERMISIS
jgi:quinolinate synthase